MPLISSTRACAKLVGKAGLEIGRHRADRPASSQPAHPQRRRTQPEVPECCFTAMSSLRQHVGGVDPDCAVRGVAQGRLQTNDNIVLIGFGGGLTWAAAAIQWQVVPVRKPQGVTYRLSQSRREAMYIAAFWRTRILVFTAAWKPALKGSPLNRAVPTRRA